MQDFTHCTSKKNSSNFKGIFSQSINLLHFPFNNIVSAPSKLEKPL